MVRRTMWTKRIGEVGVVLGWRVGGVIVRSFFLEAWRVMVGVGGRKEREGRRVWRGGELRGCVERSFEKVC